MTQEHFQQIEELYHAAREATASERTAMLAQADPELRRVVESLLAARFDGDLFERPAIDNAAPLPGCSTVAEVSSGTILGPYQVESKLGEGGMGQVFRAVDTRLGRSVAIKISHEQFTSRFEREARAISSLNHPNICTLHDIGPNYLVMELVEGETLAACIKENPLPIEVVVRYAGQIASALAEAHAKGIIHRDLKPGNIMVAKSGVKVLDFGLAKSGHDETVTANHMVMGTPAYMAPEQRQGKRADARSDIYSFGCVLYEMLTSSRIGPVRKRFSSAKLERIVSRCLEEDPERRWQSASELEGALAEVTVTGNRLKLQARSIDGTQGRSRAWLYARLGLAVAGVTAGGYLYLTRKSPAPAVNQAEWTQVTDFADSAVSPALSSDGRMLTFIRGGNTFFGSGQIYVKLLPDGEPVQLTHDTVQKMSPEFSPDGSRVTYTTVPSLWDTWVVPVLGGEPRLMMANAEGLTWIDAKNLLFSETLKGLHMVLATAGINREHSRDVYVPPRERGMAHRSAISPDHRWVLLTEMDNGGWLPCRLIPFDGSSTGRTVGPGNGGCTSVAWSRDGVWMYFSSDSGSHFHIWRQRFPDGRPEQVTFGATEEEGIAMVPDGHSFITSVGLAQSTIVLHDSKGDRQLSSASHAANPRFSPDGKSIFYLVPLHGASGHLTDLQSGELFRVSLETGENQRLLPGITMGGYAIFPDGKRVVFSATDSEGESRLWIADIDLRSSPRQFASSANEDTPNVDQSGNIYFRAAEGGSNFLYRMKEDGSYRVRALPYPIIGSHGLSPDGHWAVVGRASPADASAPDLAAVPLAGGSPVTLCHNRCDVIWGNQGKLLAVLAYVKGTGKTILFQVGVNGLPSLSPGGVDSTDHPETLKGAKVVDSLITPGPNAGQYAFLKETVHRNLYRIPLR